MAVDGYHEDIIKLLMQAGASAGVQDHFGKVPADYAQTRDIQTLLETSSQPLQWTKSEDRARMVQSTLGTICKQEECANVEQDVQQNPDPELGQEQEQPEEDGSVQDQEQCNDEDDLHEEEKVVIEEPFEPDREDEPIRVDAMKGSARGLETLREEDSNLEATGNVKHALEAQDRDYGSPIDIVTGGNEDADNDMRDNESDEASSEHQEEPAEEPSDQELPSPPKIKISEDPEDQDENEGAKKAEEEEEENSNGDGDENKENDGGNNELTQYEEVAKDKSPKDMSIHYFLTKSGKNPCGASLESSTKMLRPKLDTNSELFLQLDCNSNENSSRATLDTNMNYTKTASEVADTFFHDVTAASTRDCTAKLRDFSIRLKKEERKPSQQQSQECVAPVLLRGEGEVAAVFKSQRNDVPAYITDRKRIKMNKSDNKVVADIYNELLNQMQNYSKLGGDGNNSSVEYGDSVFFETVNDNYEQFEKMLNQEQTHKTPFRKNAPTGDDEMELESPAERSNVKLNVFPVDSCNLPSTQSPPRVPHKQVYVSEDLDRWLETLNLRAYGPALAEAGILSKADVVSQLEQISVPSYEAASVFLKEKGVRKQGARDRLILSAEQELGQYQGYLEKNVLDRVREKRGEGNELGFGCCSKMPRIVPDFIHPPSLQHWLARQNLGTSYDKFAAAGYDDYEWMLVQMCSEHPITDKILEKDVGIQQSSVRTRILFKLQEGKSADNKRGSRGGRVLRADTGAEVRTEHEVRGRGPDYGVRLHDILRRSVVILIHSTILVIIAIIITLACSSRV